MSDFIDIGIIGRPHGIKGEIRVSYYAESLDLLDGVLFLRDRNNSMRPAKVESFRETNGGLLIKFQEINDRTQAESKRGYVICVPRSSLPDLDDGEVYLDDIIGFSVIDADSGSKIGTIEFFLFSTEPEVWGIITLDGKEFLFPAAEQFVRGFDFENHSVTIAPPDGLYEIYNVKI